MPFSTPSFNIETEEHAESTTMVPAVKLEDKLMDEILSQIHEEGMGSGGDDRSATPCVHKISSII